MSKKSDDRKKAIADRFVWKKEDIIIVKKPKKKKQED